ncbi:hypothetical protein QBC34DRAFT_457967 [Podospora aff. communis PSN243]|uniref:Uncharacterized protein n=1 Tax=Podospora aff. communis PSN243 TaxID=3040156 RepID=A0AAV9GYM4_9PEZI|nr:hypothetical protein QBC34DRAFT_457967 [Podospora aff. communis PSN243]
MAASQDSLSPSAFIYSSSNSGPVPSMSVPQQKPPAYSEEAEAVPETHDLNEPLVNPMFPSLAPLGLSSQSYRRERTSLRPIFKTVDWEPHTPADGTPIKSEPSEPSPHTSPSHFWFAPSGNMNMIAGSRHSFVPEGYCHHPVHHPDAGQQGYAAVHRKSPISPQSRNQLLAFHDGTPKHAACNAAHPLPRLEKNMDEHSEHHLSSTLSTSSLSVPPHIGPELRTICLLATQRYLRTHTQQRNHRHERLESYSNHTIPSPTPYNSPRTRPVHDSNYRVSILVNKLSSPSLPTLPIAAQPYPHQQQHQQQSHASPPHSTTTNSTMTIDQIRTPNHQAETSDPAQPAKVPSTCASPLLTNTSKICSLLWKRARAQDKRSAGVSVTSERRAASQMRMLLEWADTVVLFDEDELAEGEVDSIAADEALEAAEGFCEFLGDEEGVKRVGELVWEG